MRRTPSLRELRRNCPANVVILPTAAPTQVKQRPGRAYWRAKRELIDGQAVTFPHKWPFRRERERLEQSPVLRADVPSFDPSNHVHLRAWELIWDVAQRHQQTDAD